MLCFTNLFIYFLFGGSSSRGRSLSSSVFLSLKTEKRNTMEMSAAEEALRCHSLAWKARKLFGTPGLPPDVVAFLIEADTGFQLARDFALNCLQPRQSSAPPLPASTAARRLSPPPRYEVASPAFSPPVAPPLGIRIPLRSDHFGVF